MYRYYKMLLRFGVVKLAIIGAILLAAGVGTLVWVYKDSSVKTETVNTEPRRSVVIPKDLKIVRQSSGGLTGKGDGNDMTITADGALTFTKTGMKKFLTYGDLEELVIELEDAKYFELDSSYSSEGTCPDAFGSALTVTMNGKTKQITIGDCQSKKLPDHIKKLSQYMRELGGVQ